MNIKEAIQRLAATKAEIYCKICTVDAIDAVARTVDVSPIDESAPILGVNLQAGQQGEAGIVCLPKEGSCVVVAFLSDNTAVVVLTEQIDKLIASIGEEDSVEIVAEKSSLKITIGATTIKADGEKHITFNGGENGGFAITPELKTQLDKMTARIDGIINAIKNAKPVPQDGGAALQTTMVAALNAIIDKEDFSNIENADIMH